ncbi:MBL fold metallo-hydrolase [Haloplanus sp. GCM10025708]|uniref:MBL fold metallo-hydrolase n=1 Tax=Haloferacaceae TaxID=1644056 RepID=UPI00361C02FA
MTRIDRVPVEVPTSAPAPTNAYVVGDDEVLLVDPAAESAALDAALEGRTVSHLAVTHTHPDHVGGVAAYADRTGATVWARRGREAEFAAATGVDPDRTFGDGTTLLNGVRVVDTPGHASDHVAFVTASGVVSGDVAFAEGSVVVPAPEGDMRAYLVSLRRLHARAPPRLYPGHGPVVDDPKRVLERLVRHRRDRERRVERAIREGADDLDAVLDAVYEKDLTGVRDLARATVHAHVEKLAAEGRVRFDRDAGRVAPGRAADD